MNTMKLPHKERFTAATIALTLLITLPTSALLIRDAVAQTTHEVKISGLAFVPQNLTINTGDTILWNNTDPVIHTLWFVFVANDSTYLLSDPIPPDATWSHTFNENVELQYYSFNMLWITGFINVTTGASDIAVTDLYVCIGSTIIHGGSTCCVNVTVTNEGIQAETFTLTLYWNTTNLIASTSVSLAIGITKNVTFSWNTLGYLEYANYTLSAYATPVPGEGDITDNNYIDGDILIVHTGDADANHFVEIKDILAMALAYGSYPGHPNYDPNLDVNCDAFIDIKDILATAINYGWS